NKVSPMISSWTAHSTRSRWSPSLPSPRMAGSALRRIRPSLWFPKKNPIPFVHSYNLTYQREIGWGMTFDVGYVGNLGRQLPYNQQLNAAAPGTGAAGRPFNQRFGRTADVSLRAMGVNSNYNSLQAN